MDVRALQDSQTSTSIGFQLGETEKTHGRFVL
jgi:hypothetical protein